MQYAVFIYGSWLGAVIQPLVSSVQVQTIDRGGYRHTLLKKGKKIINKPAANGVSTLLGKENQKKNQDKKLCENVRE